MQQNAANFRWNKMTDQAAEMVATDEHPDAVIAATCQVHRVTLHRWKQHPEFQQRVAARRATYRAEIEAQGIAVKANREAGMVARHKLLERVRAARAEAYAAAPGGDTGLIVGKVVLVKVYDAGDEREAEDGSDTLYSAKRYREVWEYGLDGALLKEMRDLEKHIAQERGEWVTKQALTDAKGDSVDLAAIVLAARQAAPEASA